jgi:beta-galactosidase
MTTPISSRASKIRCATKSGFSAIIRPSSPGACATKSIFSGNRDKVKKLLSRMVDLTHQLDPRVRRRSAAASAAGWTSWATSPVITATARGFSNPGIPSIVSEYGSVTSNRPGKYDGQFKPKDGLDENTPEYPWRSGQVVWCGFDYGTIFGPIAGSKGIVDYARIPKRSWYWYRSTLLHIPPPAWPRAALPPSSPSHRTRRRSKAPTPPTTRRFWSPWRTHPERRSAIRRPSRSQSNPGPGEFPTGRTITFDPAGDIPIRDGKAAIEFRSYYGGQSVIRATSAGLKDGVLTITTTASRLFVAGTTPLAPDRPYVRFVARPRQSGHGESGRRRQSADRRQQ